MAAPLRLRFRTKLFAALGLLVATALAAALLVVRSETERRVRQDFELRFERTLAAFRQLQALRRRAVTDDVDALAAANPQFRTVLSTASIGEDDLGFGGGPSREETLRDANLRLRSLLPSLPVAARHEVFAVANATGELIYSQADPERFGDSLLGVPPIPQAIAGEEAVTLWGRAGDVADALVSVLEPNAHGVYEVVAVPVEFGDELHGLVLLGTRIERSTLDAMRAISGLHVGLLGGSGPLESTLDADTARALAERLAGAAGASRPRDARTTDEQRFAGTRWLTARAEIVPGAGTETLAFLLLASIDEELAFLPALQWSFAGLGLAILAVALGIAFALARGVAEPVAVLAGAARRVGAGDLSTQVAIHSGDELETLGAAFNRMVDGLRERDAIRRTFERHVSREVAEELLRNPSVAAARGARREVTVLFADLAGFTTISEQRTPEVVVACLNEYFEVLCEAVLATGGTMNDLLGDGVIASWGAPIAHADHAVRALRAALRASDRLARLAQSWQQRGLPALAWRMGIDTGEVVVGEMGTAERTKYGIIGDAVNVASRLEGVNKIFETSILLSEQTRTRLGEAFELCEVDTVRVAGRAAPLRIFTPLGEAGSVDAERLAARDRYEAALSAYRARDFASAGALLDAAPSGAARILRERTLVYLEQAPPASWDGVFDAPKE